MNKFINFLAGATCGFLFASCGNRELTPAPVSVQSWREELKGDIPLLGHRNWIVITDMAYPLQTQPGIKTVYTHEAYMDILDFVCREIAKAPHIKATVYQDRELLFLNEKNAAGIDTLRNRMNTLLGNDRNFLPHEQLIDRLDEVSRKFNVVILKSNLTVPYTSTFMELDCNYWDGEREMTLRQTIAKGE
jgi:hypothetical protein